MHREEREIAGKPGAFRIDTRFTTPAGEVAAIETYEFAPAAAGGGQDRVVYHLEQRLVGESGTVEREGRHVAYRFTDSRGREHVDTEDVGEEWGVGPMVLSRLKEKWGSILAGETVGFRVGVLDRQDSYAFRYRPDSATLPAGKDPRGVRVWLEAASPLVRLVVKPVEIWMKPDGSGFESIQGRTLLKTKVGGRIEDFTGYIEFVEKP